MVIDHPASFKEGVRLLMRILRKKDGGPADTDRSVERIVVNGPEEFDKVFKRMQDRLRPKERIYASLSPRDLQKAIYEFRVAQLRAEREEDPVQFYLNIQNRWIRVLMKQECCRREDKLWILDVDNVESSAHVFTQLERLEVPIVRQYNTPNGFHIVVKPFNTASWPKCSELLKKDAMLLWAWKEAE